jgi:arylsulfatase
MIFTDYYAEQSCTAGRSAFLTGQATFRTGLSRVGVPGATVGLQKEDPTIAELLKHHIDQAVDKMKQNLGGN